MVTNELTFYLAAAALVVLTVESCVKLLNRDSKPALRCSETGTPTAASGGRATPSLQPRPTLAFRPEGVELKANSR